MNRASLVDRLRELCRLAEQAGADRVWLGEIADDLITLILAERHDPRHHATLAVARRMANVNRVMREHGHSPAERLEALRRRYGKSRSRVYALLALSVSYDIARQNKR